MRRFGPWLLWLSLCLAIGEAQAQPAPPADPNKPVWSETEAWVQETLRAGDIADLDRHCGGRADPRKQDDPVWSDACRRLGARFLVALLASDGWRHHPMHRGIRINGAHVTEPLDLSALRVDAEVIITRSRFDHRLRLEGARFAGGLMLDGSLLADDLRADELRVANDLCLCNTQVLTGKIHLDGARIDGALDLRQARIPAGITAQSIEVGHSVFLRESDLAAGPGATAPSQLNLVNARIGGNLSLSHARLQVVDLAGADIKGVLTLASTSGKPPEWVTGARLMLRNAHVGAIEDDPRAGLAAWPDGEKALDIQGFTYDRLGGFLDDGGKSMLTRGSREYAALLRRDPQDTRQPYQQLAAVLTAAGYPEHAADIRYESRERERQAAYDNGEYRRAFLLWVQKVTIGYGIGERIFRVLFWIAGLSFAGALVLGHAKEPHGFLWRLAASFDQLLPFIELNKEFGDYFKDPDQLHLYRWQIAYFSAHALIGFVLGGFVLAAMGGLTQAH